MNGTAAAGGALSGAASGAAIGSVVPGIGTAIGAIGGGLIGGLTGLFSDSGQDKFQATDPYSSDQFNQALAQQGQVYNKQQILAQALMAQANGQGPNPALAQLHQTTDQNAQAAAGLLASQRGINPALAARTAAQTEANANQTANGQAATLSAQQQLAAQGQLGGLYNNMAAQGLSQQQLMAQTNLGTQGINAGVASGNAQAGATYAGGVMNGVGSLGGMLLQNQLKGGGSGSSGSQLAGAGDNLGSSGVMTASTGGRIPGRPNVPGDSLKNDTVPTLLSPGEIVIPRSHADNAEMAKEFIDHLMSQKSTKKKSSGGGYGRVLEAHRKLGDALKAVGAQ